MITIFIGSYYVGDYMKLCMICFFIVFFTIAHAENIHSPIVGTWKLIAMDKQNEVGKWQPRCISPTGLITYTSQGYMAVGINCMMLTESKNIIPDPHDIIFYTGTYSIKNNMIIHHVKNSVNPEFYGINVERRFMFETQDKIILSGKGKNGQIVRMEWERLGNYPITH